MRCPHPHPSSEAVKKPAVRETWHSAPTHIYSSKFLPLRIITSKMPWVARGSNLKAASGVTQLLATRPGEMGCNPAPDPGASGNLQWPQGMGQTHLCVGVCDRVVHKDHHQDGDGNAKIPDDASSLPRAVMLEARG